jgi:outer membrane murein-binding lipoprotein Lpp
VVPVRRPLSPTDTQDFAPLATEKAGVRTMSNAQTVNRRFLGAAVAAALALAGCGSSGSSGLSKSALAAKVNAACTAYKTGVNAIPQPSDFVQNPVAAAAYLDKLKPFIDAEYNSITALQPDSSVKADFDAYVTDGKRQTALFNDARAKAHARNPAGLQDIRQAQVYKQTVLVPLERKLGFTACLP